MSGYATSPAAEANRRDKVRRVVELCDRDGIGVDLAATWGPAERRAVERAAGVAHATAGAMTWDAILRELARPVPRGVRQAVRYFRAYGPPS